MYARISTLPAKPGSVADMAKIAEESVIPAAKQQAGFEHIYILADHVANKIVVVSLWATEADLETSEANAFYQQQLAKAAPFLAGAPTREKFVVDAHG